MPEVNETLKEFGNRVRNPLVGSLVIAFVLFNWRVFSHLLLSGDSVNDRLTEIDKIGFNIWEPFAIGFLYFLLNGFVFAIFLRISQIGTDLFREVQLSQGPRVIRNMKLKEDTLSVREAIISVRPTAVEPLDKAVAAFSQFINLHRGNVLSALNHDQKKEFNEHCQNINGQITELFGTPLNDKISHSFLDYGFLPAIYESFRRLLEYIRRFTR